MVRLRGIVEHRLIPLAERPHALQPEPVALSLSGLRQTGLGRDHDLAGIGVAYLHAELALYGQDLNADPALALRFGRRIDGVLHQIGQHHRQDELIGVFQLLGTSA